MTYTKQQVTIDLEEYQDLIAKREDRNNALDVKVAKLFGSLLLHISMKDFPTQRLISDLLAKHNISLSITGFLDGSVPDFDLVKYELIK